MNMKNFMSTFVPAAVLLFLSPFLLVIAFLTSLIWLPVVLMLSSTLAIVYFVFQKTPIGGNIKAFYQTDIKERIEKTGGLKVFLLENLNNTLCIIFPKLQRKVINHGYAVVNQDGRLISDVSVKFEDERFPLQLYHYLATSFEKYKTLGKWSVLEIESEMGGGLEYIANSLKARRCVGITSSDNKIRFCSKTYADTQKLEFYETDIDNLSEHENLRGQKFDLILNVEGRSRYGLEHFKVITEEAAKLLKSGGVFICADYGLMPDMAQMANILENSGLRMVKKENLTLNILHGFKLEKKRKQSLSNISFYGSIRSLLWNLRSYKREKLETSLKEEESIYLAFLLKKD